MKFIVWPGVLYLVKEGYLLGKMSSKKKVMFRMGS